MSKKIGFKKIKQTKMSKKNGSRTNSSFNLIILTFLIAINNQVVMNFSFTPPTNPNLLAAAVTNQDIVISVHESSGCMYSFTGNGLTFRAFTRTALDTL